MESELMYLDLPMLEAMLAREERELSMALLKGASWNELEAQRNRITELSIVIHKRLHPLDGLLNPAEFNGRSRSAE